MKKKTLKMLLAATVCLVLHQLTLAPASATLVFYYDPLTGNVSFDSANTRSGALRIYQLELFPSSPIRFRPENFIRTFSSTYGIARDNKIGDASLSDPVSGLYTIGDILPPGLSAETWASIIPHPNFGVGSPVAGAIGYAYYLDELSMGLGPPPEMVYGRPDREFDNRWDLVDPDTLNWATSVTLVYRPWNGEVLLDTTGSEGGYITGFVLESNDDFLSDNFIKFIESPYFGATSSVIGLFADAIEPDIYSLGTILEAGLTESELGSKFNSAKFFGRAGFAGASVDLTTDGQPMAIMVDAVPEPASILLSVVVFAMLVLRRSLTGQSYIGLGGQAT